MQLIANGLTSLEIAEKIEVSEESINERIQELELKYNCKNRVHLAITLMRKKDIR